MRYAIVRRLTGYVENVCEWDGVSSWAPPDGYDAIPGDIAQIGGTWDGTTFTGPGATTDQHGADYRRCREYVVSTASDDTADRLTAYLANASPTQAESVAAIKETIRTLRALIRIVRQVAAE